MAKRTCSLDGCDRPHNAKGLCATHYRQLRHEGRVRPLPPPRRKGRGAEARFFEKLEQHDDCWVWTAYKDREGYGMFGLARGVTVKAHRWAYEFLRAEIPYGLQLDHLCRNRSCVNPWHLEPVTAMVNNLRMPPTRAKRSVCVNGHPMVGDNVKVHPRTGRRTCLACLAARRASRRSTS